MVRHVLMISHSASQKVIVMLAAILWGAACGGGKEITEKHGSTSLPNGAGSTNGQPAKPASGHGGKSNKTQLSAGNRLAAVGNAPSEALQVVFNGLAQGQPLAFWNALPAGYQKDVNHLAKVSIASIDSEVRAKFFEILNKSAVVLKDKKPLILPAMKSLPEAAEVGGELAVFLANYDDFIVLFGDLGQSDLANPAWQQNPNIGRLLDRSGAKLMGRGMTLAKVFGGYSQALKISELMSAKVKMGQPQGTNPTVVITTTRTVSTNTVLQVEGKWLPQNLVLVWKPLISQMKVGPEGKPMNTETRQIYLRRMDAIIEAILAIERAQDERQMGQAIGSMMRIFKMLSTGDESVPEQIPAGRRNTWNYGSGERSTRIEAFIRQPQTAVQKVFGSPDNRVPSQNPNQVDTYWLYRRMKINDLTKQARVTKVYFGIKNGGGGQRAGGPIVFGVEKSSILRQGKRGE